MRTWAALNERFRTKMLKFILCVLVLGAVCNYVEGMGDSMIDTGCWEIHAIDKCEGDFPLQFEVEKRKANRTHNCFNSIWHLERLIDDSCGVQVKICKVVDGGCKDYNSMADESVVKFIDKIAPENLAGVLALGGIEPASFPIAPGDYEIIGYQLDKCEFPCKSVMGIFEALCLLLDEDANPLACLKVTIEFRECKEEEMCEKCKD